MAYHAAGQKGPAAAREFTITATLRAILPIGRLDARQRRLVLSGSNQPSIIDARRKAGCR
ncbi:MAG TPA: hypothetical protein VF553_09555 [Pyrinomonadaceae bacterium]